LLLSRDRKGAVPNKQQPLRRVASQLLSQSSMIWLAAALMALWLLGLATACTLGGFLHILLVLGLAVLLIQLTMGRREA
jgi:hypothetical protein